MNDIYAWAARWSIPTACLRDLQATLGVYTPPLPTEAPSFGKSEGWVSSVVNLEASRKGYRLWRNNVGVLEDRTGRPVRYGLANETAALNKVLKSADHIGWYSMTIEPQHVGHTFARFVSIEAKEPGWQYTGQGREVAQLSWVNMVNAAGGFARFVTGEGSL